jgi:hypothetical protein
MNNWMHYKKRSLRSTTTMQEIPYRGKKLVTKNDTTWNQSPFLEAGMQQGIRGQGSKYHARLRRKALLQNVVIPDTNAEIVTKIKQAMSQWGKYSKAEAAEHRKTFVQKKTTAIAEEKNTTMEKIMKQLRLRESQK